MLAGRGTGARLAALVTALWAGMAFAQQAAQEPPAGEEFTKQEKIYRSRGVAVPGGYITTRSLASYAELLPSGFIEALRKLGPKDRWLDIGSGAGGAILDYYLVGIPAEPGKNAFSRPRGRALQAVAVSIEDRRGERWHEYAASPAGGRVRYLHGKRLRDYSSEELGRFRIITDVYGGFSYTDDLSLFLARTLGALEVNGSFYTMLQSVHLENGKDSPRTWYLTELVDGEGRTVKVCSWLRGIPCLRVACESRSDWDAPTELIRMDKICEGVNVPPLKRTFYEAGNPPGRRFLLPQ